ncbi:MAG: hypothetical protein GY832_23745 [Chloroflexi bacterium]|nr:hypothetical protein [Chloroflexota bacterium]
MIQWGEALTATGKAQRRAAVRKIVTAETYGFGPNQWSLTDMYQDNHNCKLDVYRHLDGLGADGSKRPGAEMKGLDGTPIRFRFHVLTRQACCEDKNGKAITDSPGFIANWDTEAILAEHDDKPKKGDIVQWKGELITEDPDTGEPVTQAIKRKWNLQGKPFHEMIRWTVDEDQCIEVPYPYALSMLQKFGKHLASARFRKSDRKAIKEGATVRRIANWRFEEVPRDFKIKKKPGPKPKQEQPSSPTDEPIPFGGGGGQE